VRGRMSNIVSPAPAYRDRRAGLILFGAIHLILGVLCVIWLLGIAAGSEIGARGGGPPAPMLAQTLMVYGMLAFYFFVAGIGSIRARRWARAVILAVSWIWLVSGVISSLTMIFWIPRMLVLVPPSAQSVFIATTVAVSVILYIVVPLAFILFYRSPQVAATFAARDPVPRWTDRVPLPVLAMVMVTAAGSLVLVSLLPRPVVPLFDTILTGPPAIIVILALAGLLAFISLQLYRLRRSAWWTLLLLQVVGGIVMMITFARSDPNSLYGAMGLMTPQMQAMHVERIAGDPGFWVVTIGAWIGYLLFLLWLRRFFTGAPPQTRAADTRAVNVGQV
jgi:hypothetical protein